MQKKIRTLKELQNGIIEMREDLDAYTFGMSEEEAGKYEEICNQLTNIIRTLNKFI